LALKDIISMKTTCAAEREAALQSRRLLPSSGVETEAPRRG